MSTATSQQGAGEARLPAAYVVDIPRGSVFQLVAAWLLLTEGALALIFLPILSLTPDFDVPVGDIATFGALAVACLVAGGLLYTKLRWSVWFAIVVSLATAGWLVADEGLTSWTEAYVGVGFTVLQVAFLLLGRHAAGKPEAMALSSAHIPFRLKLACGLDRDLLRARPLPIADRARIGGGWATTSASSPRARSTPSHSRSAPSSSRWSWRCSERSAGSPRTPSRSASPASTHPSSEAPR